MARIRNVEVWMLVVACGACALWLVLNQTTTRGSEVSQATADRLVVNAYDVLKDGQKVLWMEDSPGHVISTAILPPGAKPATHPFINAHALVAAEEDQLGKILGQARDFQEYVRLLRQAGYEVTPAMATGERDDIRGTVHARLNVGMSYMIFPKDFDVVFFGIRRRIEDFGIRDFKLERRKITFTLGVVPEPPRDMEDWPGMDLTIRGISLKSWSELKSLLLLPPAFAAFIPLADERTHRRLRDAGWPQEPDCRIVPSPSNDIPSLKEYDHLVMFTGMSYLSVEAQAGTAAVRRGDTWGIEYRLKLAAQKGYEGVSEPGTKERLWVEGDGPALRVLFAVLLDDRIRSIVRLTPLSYETVQNLQLFPGLLEQEARRLANALTQSFIPPGAFWFQQDEFVPDKSNRNNSGTSRRRRDRLLVNNRVTLAILTAFCHPLAMSKSHLKEVSR
jgi:hypothetical protein